MGVLAALAGCSGGTAGHGTAQADVTALRVASTAKVAAGSPLTRLSPNGSRLLDSSGCVRNTDGTQRKCIADKEQIPDFTYSAVWSPDSTRVAFTEPYFSYLREPDIWVLDAATGAVTDLTDDGVTQVSPGQKAPAKAMLDLFPSWSADGNTIRFARQAGGDESAIELASVPAAGGAVHKLGSIEGRLSGLDALVFTPDGKSMAWSYAAQNQEYAVRTRAVSGGDDREVVAPQKSLDYTMLSISRDSKYLLVDSRAPYATYSVNPKQPSTATVVRLADGAVSAVASGAPALFPTWSPVGHGLAFLTISTANGEPTSHLHVVGTPGGTAREIWSSARASAPDQLRLGWSPGVMLVYTSAPTLLRLTG